MWYLVTCGIRFISEATGAATSGTGCFSVQGAFNVAVTPKNAWVFAARNSELFHVSLAKRECLGPLSAGRLRRADASPPCKFVAHVRPRSANFLGCRASRNEKKKDNTKGFFESCRRTCGSPRVVFRVSTCPSWDLSVSSIGFFLGIFSFVV